MDKLSNLPNIGKVIENQLNKVDIHNPKELINIGSKEAFLKIKMIDNTACLHMLYALQGAIEGIRYTQLAENTKKDLKQYYNSL